MTPLCEFQDVYSEHCYDFGLIGIPFHNTLKADAELKKQRSTRIPIHYKEKLQKILDNLEANGILERVGLHAAVNT